MFIKSLALLTYLVLAAPFSQGRSGVYDSCMWEGEEYLRDIMFTARGRRKGHHWVSAVYRLHHTGTNLISDFDGIDLENEFDGIGSCRFFLTREGSTFEIALKSARRSGRFALTHAYLQVTADDGPAFYIPEAEPHGRWVYVL